MCIRVIVQPNGQHIECANKGELRAALGVEPVRLRDTPPFEWPDQNCLCPCDIEATAAAAGYKASRDDGDAYTLRRDVRRIH